MDSPNRKLHFCYTFLLWLAISLPTVKSSAQQLIFEQAYVLNNLLPSNECYHIFKDSQGYLWIATELGLCRYDGKYLKTYDDKKGIPEKAIYAFTNIKTGIWMASSAGRLFTLTDGNIHEKRLSVPLMQQLRKKDDFPYEMRFNKKLLINSKWASYILDTLTGSVQRLPPKVTTSKLELTDDGFQIFNSEISSLVPYITLIAKLRNRPEKKFKIPFRGKWCYRYLSAKMPGKFLFAYNDQLVEVDTALNMKIHTLPGDVSAMKVDAKGGLLIGMYKTGLLYYPTAVIEKPITALQRLSISSILQDEEGSIWCTTLEKGVFICRNNKIISYANLLGDSYRQTIFHSTPRQTFAMQSDKLVRLDINGKDRPASEHETPELIEEMVGRHAKFCFHQNEHLFDLVRFGQNSFFGISYPHLYHIDDQKISTYKIPMPGRCLAVLDSNHVLFGTGDALYRFSVRKKSYERLTDIPARPLCILVTSDKRVLVGTKGKGILQYVNGKLRTFLSSGIINDMQQEANGIIWLATNDGIVKHFPNGKQIRYDASNGLPSKYIYRLKISGERIYLNTSEGVCSFPKDAELRNLKQMPFRLISSTANGKSIDLAENPALPFPINNINLKFHLLSFANQHHKVRYRLSPTDNTWKEQSASEISMENLHPGKYQLTVFGKNSDGVLSKPISLSFSIDPPYWQRWWFILTSIILAVALLIWLTSLFFRRLRRREKEKNRIDQLLAESRLAALQAQMNPHFVFNCINSIQHYIVAKETDKACDYLGRFSRLIRMVLLYSREREVTLSQEIELLSIYVSLEQLRFAEHFDYELKVDPDLDCGQVKIPALLLQPHVENAIWHGLLPRTEKGRGKLSIIMEGTLNGIEITITDNGVGREMAKKNNAGSLHRSTGLKMNTQRMAMLNQLYKTKFFSSTIEDLYDANGQSKGTRVKVNIPSQHD